MQPNNSYDNQTQYQPQGVASPTPGVPIADNGGSEGLSGAGAGAPKAGGAVTAVRPRKWSLLIVGGGLAVALIVVGVILQVSYQAKDETGRTVSELEREIAALDEQTAAMAKNEAAVFGQEGFSSSFYETAGERTDVELAKDELVAARDEILAQGGNNIFRTGAGWCFIAAIVVLIIAITVFVRV